MRILQRLALKRQNNNRAQARAESNVFVPDLSDQSINQSVDQSNNQSINRSFNQLIKLFNGKCIVCDLDPRSMLEQYDLQETHANKS